MAPLQDVLSDHRSRAEKEGSRRPYAAFGGAVVPERNLLTRELLSGLSAQFWGQQLQSSQSLDGLVTAAPGQPSPLPLAAPSGLSRVQFLVASQAAAPPCFPSYCEEHGGLVLDRVLVKGGGDGWWGALTGRAKVRNLLAAYQDQQLVRQLKNPANYLLCASSKVSLGSNTTLRVKGELDGQSWDNCTPAPAASGDSSAGATPAPPLTSATVQLRHKMRSTEARAELGFNRKMLLMGGPSEAGAGYTSVPVDLTLDVATPSGSASALQYRLGLHHMTGQGLSAGLDPGGPLGHALHLQSAAAVHGETTLWRHRPAQGSAQATSSSAPTSRPTKGAPPSGSQQASTTVAPRSAEQTRQSSSTVAPGGAASSKPPTKTIGPHNPLRKSLGKVLSSLTGGTAGGNADEGKGSADRPGKRGMFRLGSGTADSAGGSAPLFEPEQIQEALLDSTQSISRLREDVQGITSWVSDGKLVDSLAQGRLLGPFAPKKRVAKDSQGKAGAKDASTGPQRVSRNAALSQPHFKVGGMLGVAARVPLVHHHGSEAAGTSPQQATAHSQPAQQRQQQQGQQEAGEAAEPLASAPSGMQRLVSLSRDWLQQQLHGDFSQRSAILRPFASGGMLLQLGSMQRGLLDFTRIMAKADLGLLAPHETLGKGIGKTWSTAVLSQQGAHTRRSSAGRTGRDGYGVWHALTLSLSQQLFGPVRLCADLRFALEPGQGPSGSSQVPGAESERANRLRGLSAHVLSTRASLVDSVVALDVAVPSTSGLARVVAWYAPSRREGMLELRLF